MRALWLDYQQEAPARRRSGLLLLAMAVLVTSLLLARYAYVADELVAAGLQLSRLQRMAPAGLAHDVPVELPTATHWEALFHSLEAASDDTVTLLSLQSGKEGVLMSGEASSLDAAIAYVLRLQSAPLLADVTMTQSEVVRDHPRQPVRFNLVTGTGKVSP